MSGFWDTLNKVNNTLDQASNVLDGINEKIYVTKDTVDTSSYSINKIQSSKDNLDRIERRIKSGENDRDWKKAMEYEEKGNRCIHRTIIFCIILILITVCVCVFA